MSIALWFKRTNRPKTNLEVCISVLKRLNSKRFSKVYTSDKSIITIKTNYTTITEYTKQLGVFYHYLNSEDEVVYKVLLPNDLYTIPMYEFFLDAHNCYIDIPTTTKEFTDASIKILTLYNEISNKETKSFSNNKNLLFMNDIITNLLALITVLDSSL